MDTDIKQRSKHMILGALVADAAAMGLHWIYDQKRIKQVCADAPEFHELNKNDYEEVIGFYAHDKKATGDFSHYGEQLMVMLRALAANNGRYDKALYENFFRDHFGYGGAYTGYIDHPTRETLDNISRAEFEALNRAKAIPLDRDSNVKNAMISKVLAHVKQGNSKLHERIEEAVRLTHDEDILVEYAFNILNELESISGFHGADDVQLPAVSKLPALVCCYSQRDSLSDVVESAVRVTNNNDFSVECGKSCAQMLGAALQGFEASVVVDMAKQNSKSEVSKLIDSAINLKEEDNLDATSEFGLSCNLSFGIPSLIHNLITATSYQDAIRTNIYAGGDSCGRSIILGAALGAIHGVGGEYGIPQEWINQLNEMDEANELIENLFK